MLRGNQRPRPTDTLSLTSDHAFAAASGSARPGSSLPSHTPHSTRQSRDARNPIRHHQRGPRPSRRASTLHLVATSLGHRKPFALGPRHGLPRRPLPSHPRHAGSSPDRLPKRRHQPPSTPRNDQHYRRFTPKPLPNRTLLNQTRYHQN